MSNKAEYGIIGFPLGHSFSKKYFMEKFAREGIEADFLNFEMEDISVLRELVAAHPNLQGFSVTIPHKQTVIPLLNRLSDEAAEIGAVNCVRVLHTLEGVQLEGYNTDAAGFRASLLQFIPSGIQRALILGNGGAAKAVRYVLRQLGMEVITVSRTPHASDEIGYGEVDAYLKSTFLIVNTTPLGTWPNVVDCPPLPYSLLTSEHYLFDLVYNPEITEFMKQGTAAGAHVRNGLEMLHEQAEEGWRVYGL